MLIKIIELLKYVVNNQACEFNALACFIFVNSLKKEEFR